MDLIELASYILKSTELSEDEYFAKLNALGGEDLRKAKQLIIIIDMTRESAYSVGYEKGGEDFKNWIISKYPELKNWENDNIKKLMDGKNV